MTQTVDPNRAGPSRRRARFADHPDRAAAQDDIHARPIVPVGAPGRVRRVVFLLGRDPHDVQNQTQTILGTMSRTTQSQLRLQTTVEGLSTIAISYYALGILGTVLKGVFDGSDHQKALALAALAPLVLLATWLGIRRIHRAHAG